MAKFSGASGVQQTPEQIKQLQQLTQAQLPTGVAPEQEVETAPQGGSLLSDIKNAPVPTEMPGGLASEPTQGSVSDEEIGTESEPTAVPASAREGYVPNLRERQNEPEAPRWNMRDPISVPQVAAVLPKGGVNERASSLIDVFATGGMKVGIQLTGAAHAAKTEGASTDDVATAAAEAQPGTFASAVYQLGALTQDPEMGVTRPSDAFLRVSSVAIENSLADLAFGQDEEYIDRAALTSDEAAAGLGEDGKPKKSDPKEGAIFAKTRNNEQLGQQIALDLQRLTNPEATPKKLPRREAETLANTMKTVWAKQNPDMLKNGGKPIRVPGSNEDHWQLSVVGAEAMKKSEDYRKRIFPKQTVRPLKTPPLKGELPGDIGANIAKKTTGRLKGQQLDKRKRKTEEAKKNASTIAHIVDPRKGKVAFLTVLPMLKSGNLTGWQGKINGMGQGQLNKLEVAAASQAERVANRRRNDPSYNEQQLVPEKELKGMADDLARSLRAIVRESKGANFLTYYDQAFNSRITPQQSLFDPTNSKLVRFAAGGDWVIYSKGTRQEKALRQMYAMTLLPKSLKADGKLPLERERLLDAHSGDLYQMGLKIKEAFAMDNDTYNTLNDAIEQGISLSDPNFPAIPEPKLDPNNKEHAEIIKRIEEKGEDGNTWIEGMMDYVDHKNAMDAGRQHKSRFKAAMDGKTNGIAANAIQMGNIDQSFRTGVFRESTTDLLDEGGDIRDQLAEVLDKSLDDGGFQNVADEGIMGPLVSAAKQITNGETTLSRDLNKAITMTYGYGKEIESFEDTINDTIGEMYKAAQADPENNFNEEMDLVNESGIDFAKAIIEEHYGPSIEKVMSPEGVESRSLMRGAAVMSALWNQPFTIKDPVGNDLFFGKGESVGYDQAEGTTRSAVTVEGEKATSVYTPHYETIPTAAAKKGFTDADTGTTKKVAGEYAYGGSIPGPVQSIDAATVTETFSGKSWDKIKNVSNGKPYVHSVYDAFIVDANSYDTVLEEVNENWLKVQQEWSYLEETQKAYDKGLKEWQASMATRDNSEVMGDQESSMFNELMEWKETAKGPKPAVTLGKKLSKLVTYNTREDLYAATKRVSDKLKHEGYNIWQTDNSNPTVAQMKALVYGLRDEMKYASRINSLVNKTNEQKKKLIAKVKSEGYKLPNGKKISLQYYAH